MSVTNLGYDLKKGRYQVDLRMFLDDFLDVQGQLPPSGPLGQSMLVAPTKASVKSYVADHLEITLNDRPVALEVDKVKIEELTIFVTFKVKDAVPPSEIVRIKVRDSIFVDKFANQRNIIHIELPDRRRRSLLFNTHQREEEIAW